MAHSLHKSNQNKTKVLSNIFTEAGVSSGEMYKHKASLAGKSACTNVNKLDVNSSPHCVLLMPGLCFTNIKHEAWQEFNMAWYISSQVHISSLETWMEVAQSKTHLGFKDLKGLFCGSFSLFQWGKTILNLLPLLVTSLLSSVSFTHFTERTLWKKFQVVNEHKRLRAS